MGTWPPLLRLWTNSRFQKVQVNTDPTGTRFWSLTRLSSETSDRSIRCTTSWNTHHPARSGPAQTRSRSDRGPEQHLRIPGISPESPRNLPGSDVPQCGFSHSRCPDSEETTCGDRTRLRDRASIRSDRGLTWKRRRSDLPRGCRPATTRDVTRRSDMIPFR